MRTIKGWALAVACVVMGWPMDAAEVSGQVFAKGFDQPYKFAGVAVRVYDWQAAQNALETYQDVRWPDVVAQATTDVDGNFALKAPTGKYMVYAKGERRHKNGRIVIYEWRVELTVEGNEKLSVMLTGDNVFALRDQSGAKLEPPGTVR
jgi:hypothetical protein